LGNGSLMKKRGRITPAMIDPTGQAYPLARLIARRGSVTAKKRRALSTRRRSIAIRPSRFVACYRRRRERGRKTGEKEIHICPLLYVGRIRGGRRRSTRKRDTRSETRLSRGRDGGTGEVRNVRAREGSGSIKQIDLTIHGARIRGPRHTSSR